MDSKKNIRGSFDDNSCTDCYFEKQGHCLKYPPRYDDGLTRYPLVVSFRACYEFQPKAVADEKETKYVD